MTFDAAELIKEFIKADVKGVQVKLPSDVSANKAYRQLCEEVFKIAGLRPTIANSGNLYLLKVVKK